MAIYVSFVIISPECFLLTVYMYVRKYIKQLICMYINIFNHYCIVWISDVRYIKQFVL